ncbi:MAG: endonuclease III [Chlorobiota bacterium]
MKFSKTKKKQLDRMDTILSILKNTHTDARIALEYSNSLELLVATILSAQCTDARVNIVTKDLFKKYRIASDYAIVPIEQLEKDIYSTGFYRNKAKNIKSAANKLIELYDGEVPGTMDELLELDGVGRKTANVVLGHCFDTPGIVVDTHVSRLSNRLGFVNTKNPVKIEFELMELIPEEDWVMFTHYMIQHGRKTCDSRSPKCNDCVISDYCPSYEKFIKKNKKK